MKIISEQKLKDLLIDSEILRRLDNGGVDNWMNYYESLNDPDDIEDWEVNSLDNVMKNYPDYTFTDNYNFD